jgi:hypothetical protein
VFAAGGRCISPDSHTVAVPGSGRTRGGEHSVILAFPVAAVDSA